MPFLFVSRLAFDVMRERAESAERDAEKRTYIAEQMAFDCRSELKAFQERYDLLLAKTLEMKQAGFVAPAAPRALPASRPPEPSPEERALLAHEQAFLANAEQAFLSQGKSVQDAKAMAELLRDGIRESDTGIPVSVFHG